MIDIGTLWAELYQADSDVARLLDGIEAAKLGTEIHEHRLDMYDAALEDWWVVFRKAVHQAHEDGNPQ